jgi:hypothetical protein
MHRYNLGSGVPTAGRLAAAYVGVEPESMGKGRSA